MAKKSKKKAKQMTSNNPDKPKTNSFYGDEVISVLKMKFVDGQTVASYLRAGGSKGQLRAAIKSGAIKIELPKVGGADRSGTVNRTRSTTCS